MSSMSMKAVASNLDSRCLIVVLHGCGGLVARSRLCPASCGTGKVVALVLYSAQAACIRRRRIAYQVETNDSIKQDFPRSIWLP